MRTLDKILLITCLILMMFVTTMIILFCIFGETPDTLISNFFTLFNSEIILTFVIWWAKRKDKKEDKEKSKKSNL